MRKATRVILVCFSLIPVLTLSRPVFADSIFNFSIDTTAIAGTPAKLAFDFTVNQHDFNFVDILNFSAPGSTMGLPTTQGGLVTGDLILGLNPAPFTRIDGDFFFNELVVSLTQLGNSIAFQLHLTENAPPGLPDQFSFFLLNASGKPLFPTSDPLGTNSLFAFDVTGAPGGRFSVFSPAIFTAPNNIQITVPGPAPVSEPTTFLLLLSGLAGLAGCKWKSYLKLR